MISATARLSDHLPGNSTPPLPPPPPNKNGVITSQTATLLVFMFSCTDC